MSPATPSQVRDLRAFASIEAAVQLAPAVIGEAGGCAHWGVDRGPARYRRYLAQRSVLTENIDDGPDVPGTEGYDLLRETLSITDDLISTMAVVDGTDRHCKQALQHYLGAIGVAERANDDARSPIDAARRRLPYRRGSPGRRGARVESHRHRDPLPGDLLWHQA
jgi:hypothetical protein